jgi:hypothetical protein
MQPGAIPALIDIKAGLVVVNDKTQSSGGRS